MKKLIFLIAALCLVSTSTFGRGGAIGGGEVTIYPLYKCNAESLNKIFNPAARSLVVSGEKDFSGNLIPSISVTIQLYDNKGKVLASLPTQTSPKDFSPRELVAREYPQSFPGQLNRSTALLQVNGSDGYLLPSKTLKVVDMLKLTNCKYLGSID